MNRIKETLYSIPILKSGLRGIARVIRRTVKTLMGKAGIDKAIRDRIQNHSLQDVSSKYYDRYDYLPEKRIFDSKKDTTPKKQIKL